MGRRRRERHQQARHPRHQQPRRRGIHAMGNEESTMVDDSTRPSVLEARNIDAVAKYIKQHKVRRIVVMVWSLQ